MIRAHESCTDGPIHYEPAVHFLVPILNMRSLCLLKFTKGDRQPRPDGASGYCVLPCCLFILEELVCIQVV